MLKLYKLCNDLDAFLKWNNFVFTHSVIAVKKLASGTKKYITIPFFLFLLIKNVCIVIVTFEWLITKFKVEVRKFNQLTKWRQMKKASELWINFFSSLPFNEYHKTVFPFFINVGQKKHRLVRFIKFLYNFFLLNSNLLALIRHLNAKSRKDVRRSCPEKIVRCKFLTNSENSWQQ